MERSITINGKSKSALENYSRQLAHQALHYNRMPLELDVEEVMDYLYQVKSNGEASDSFFKFTVHEMRYACKMQELDYAQFELSSLKGPKKLPIVLNGSEIKVLISSCKLLRHRLIIGCVTDVNLGAMKYNIWSHLILIWNGNATRASGQRLERPLCAAWKNCYAEELPAILTIMFPQNTCLNPKQESL